MPTFSTNQFKPGLKLILDGEPCSIIKSEFTKPGKGQAFYRVKLRNLKNGRVLEKTYKSGESAEGADVTVLDMQYLYHDSDLWHFMDLNSYEQYPAETVAMADAAKWLKEHEICTVTLWNNSPLFVQAPNFVMLQIAETDPGVRGDTAATGTKPATLETGAVVKVPLFIENGETIKIDTRTGEYVGRSKG